jgi:Integrase core domain
VLKQSSALRPCQKDLSRNIDAQNPQQALPRPFGLRFPVLPCNPQPETQNADQRVEGLLSLPKGLLRNLCQSDPGTLCPVSQFFCTFRDINAERCKLPIAEINDKDVPEPWDDVKIDQRQDSVDMALCCSHTLPFNKIAHRVPDRKADGQFGVSKAFVATDFVGRGRNRLNARFGEPLSGHTQQNGYSENFNGSLRHECLNEELFDSAADAHLSLAL